MNNNERADKNCWPAWWNAFGFLVWACICTQGVKIYAQEWTVPYRDIHADGIDYHSPRHMAISPDGATVIVSGHFYDVAADQSIAEVRCFDSATGRETNSFRYPADPPENRTFAGVISRDGSKVVVSGRGRPFNSPWIGIANLQTRKMADPISIDCRCAAFAPDDGGRLAVGAGGNTLALVNTKTGQEEWRASYGEWINCVQWSPDGKLIVTGSWMRNIAFWDATTGKQCGEVLGGVEKPLMALAFSFDGKLMASGGANLEEGDSRITIWGIERREGEVPEVVARERAVLIGHTSNIDTLAFSPDGSLLASGGYDGTVRLWNIASAKQLAVRQHADFVLCVAFTPDGRCLASLGRDALMFWTLEDFIGGGE